MSDLDLLHKKIKLLEKWMLLVDERLLKLEKVKNEDNDKPIKRKN